MSLSIRPLSDALGAEAVGVDLRACPGTETVEKLRQAILDHIVLVIRDQSFTPAQYLDAARLFGAPMRQHYSQYLMDEHPEIAVLSSRDAERQADGRRHLLGTQCWHTDHTNHAEPPKLTVLYAVSMPASGGDTSFANMRTAYAALPDAEKNRFGELKTVNVLDHLVGLSDVPTRTIDKSRYADSATHPLVRTYPENGTKALYFHPTKTERLVGMEANDSHKFVDDLLNRILRSEIIYRHKWRVGDMLLCDNRSALHRAHEDYDPDEGRIVHRVILKGDRPV